MCGIVMSVTIRSGIVLPTSISASKPLAATTMRAPGTAISTSAHSRSLSSGLSSTTSTENGPTASAAPAGSAASPPRCAICTRMKFSALSASMRRWPPTVFQAFRWPRSTQRCTVGTETPSRRARWAVE